MSGPPDEYEDRWGAATPENLTETHRAAQARIRAAALRGFVRLAPLWKGDTQSFARLVQATTPLLYTYHRLSSAAAAGYYTAVRAAEQVPGDATPRLAPPPSIPQLVKSLYVTGQSAVRDALASGRSAKESRTGSVARMGGALTRHILDGGRTTILDSVHADPHALGWYRVTDGNPCAFCLTLASRGAVYKSEETAGFQAHDHDQCVAAPFFEGTTIPNLARWRHIYNTAQNDGEASGALQPGENTSTARINAVRRYLTANPLNSTP